MSNAAGTMRPKLIGGLVGAGIATSFCAISVLSQLMPPAQQEPNPAKTLPLTALYLWLGYRNAREFGRSYKLINRHQPESSLQSGYNQLAAIHWNLTLTGTAYTVRSLMPETQIATGLINMAFTSCFAAGAYHCKAKANCPQAGQ